MDAMEVRDVMALVAKETLAKQREYEEHVGFKVPLTADYALAALRGLLEDGLLTLRACSNDTLEFSDDDNGPGDWVCYNCGASERSGKWVAIEGIGRRLPPMPTNFQHGERV